MTKNYLVLDFETTGLDYKKEQVTEVGAIKYDENFNEVATFHTYVKLYVEHGLSDFIKNLTGITEEKLEYGMTEDSAMDVIASMIDLDTIVVAQYAPFDFAYLSKDEIYPRKFICTKSLTQLADGTDVSSSLTPTCERLGIKLENAHRAMNDVEATAKVLQHRLGQDLDFVENFIMERSERAVDMFLPKYTEKFVQFTKEA